MTAVVELRGVTRTYPGTTPVHALRSCDLEVERGDFVAIVGPSGSGKSTLLNIIGLLDRATSGTYRLDGVDVSAASGSERTRVRGEHVGFVFQSFELLGYRTVLENVMLAGIYVGVASAERRRRALDALAKVGLLERQDSLPLQLSGGQRQRVAIARALAANPTLLLCDEPTGNLDSETSGTIMNLLADLNRTGVTILLITHDSDVASFANRTVAIRDGHAVEIEHR